MMIFIICIAFCYVFLIVCFIDGFDKVAEFQYQEETTKTKFSVVIPFRNEANNLPVLLNSITNLEYPVSHFELIFIKDESEDTSVEIIEKHLNNSSIDYKILQNKRFSQRYEERR